MMPAETPLPKVAKIVGASFLLFTILAAIHYSLIDLKILVPEDRLEVSNFIQTNESFFRIGIVLDLFLFSIGILLCLALFELLKSVKKLMALFAVTLLLIELTLTIGIELTSFLALSLVGEDQYLTLFNSEQMHAFLGLVLGARADGYLIATIFFGVAMSLFSYLFYKSKFIPAALAVWGGASFFFLFLSVAIKIVIPENYPAIMGTISSMSAMFFQLVLGVRLLVKGIDNRNLANR